MTEEQLHGVRHSLAHLLAAAALEFDPEAKLGVGPAIDTGFYYDISFSKPISENDLPTLEKRMRELAKADLPFSGTEVSRQEALNEFDNQPFKKELISEFAEEGQTLTIYATGDVFKDLCRGGHVEATGEIPADAFELDRLAGAYWRGDEQNQQLTRIYGLAFESKEKLDEYKKMREEAKLRDHRKLGKELDLFAFSDLVGSGLPLFTPRGTLIRDLIVEKIQDIQKEYGYQRVSIPHITKSDLYKTSGHWEKFGDELFKVRGASDTEFVMKPMNCPHHTQIYASQMRSYRDLPLRFMESTMVYRDEQAGELLGLSRVRSITQDDGHVFCRHDQIEEEVGNIVTVIERFYSALNMYGEGDFWVSLSVRDPETPEKYLGEPSGWDKAESALESVAKNRNLPYKRVEGEAAFYGPKLDFMFKDAIGREWQLATAQVDFVMPERFSLSYTASDGSTQTPAMIHRAIAGSLERFMSVIIEHFAGAFPLWLSPVQVAVLPINDDVAAFSNEQIAALKEAGVRTELYGDADSLGKKIRKAKTQKVPYFLVIGSKEAEAGMVMVESRDNGQIGQMTVTEFIERINKERNI